MNLHFGKASDPIPRVLDRAGSATTMPQEMACRRAVSGGSAPLTLNLLPSKSARGLSNLFARIPRPQDSSGFPLSLSLRPNEFTPFFR